MFTRRTRFGRAQPATADELLDRFTAGEQDFPGISIAHANLHNAHLEGVNLCTRLLWANAAGIHMSGSYLSFINLFQAYLHLADLKGCDLGYADLRETDLTGADLREANLEHADLRGADLKGALLEGASLRGARLEHTWLHPKAHTTP